MKEFLSHTIFGEDMDKSVKSPFCDSRCRLYSEPIFLDTHTKLIFRCNCRAMSVIV